MFTPNDQHYVSWHWATFPGDVDVETYRLTVRGQVNQTLVRDEFLARGEARGRTQTAGVGVTKAGPSVPDNLKLVFVFHE